MDEPRPLMESDDALARLVRGAQTLDVEYDVPAAVARHERLVAAGVPPLLPASGRGLRWAWIGGAIAVVGGAALFVARPVGSPDPVARPAAVAKGGAPGAAAIEPPQDDAVVEAAERPVIAERPVQAPTREPRATSKPRTAPSTQREAEDAPPSDDGDRIAREAAQVRRIRELLDGGDAKAALAACDAGDREFARGVFALERDGLRTLAALALDRPSARADAEAYLASHPRAPLARKIRDAVASTRGH
jgi:hypothetical protein